MAKRYSGTLTLDVSWSRSRTDAQARGCPHGGLYRVTLKGKRIVGAERAALERELVECSDAIDKAYWNFSRQAQAKPPTLACPDRYARRAEIAVLLRMPISVPVCAPERLTSAPTSEDAYDTAVLHALEQLRKTNPYAVKGAEKIGSAFVVSRAKPAPDGRVYGAADRSLLLFSYGSNDPVQLAKRLGHPVRTMGAYAPGWLRVFRGVSRTWGGGVAALKKAKGGVVYGLVFEASPADVHALNVFEGAPRIYDLRKIQVVVPELGDRPRSAMFYQRVDDASFHPPSRAYLEACARTVGAHWSGDRGKVSWRDFAIR